MMGDGWASNRCLISELLSLIPHLSFISHLSSFIVHLSSLSCRHSSLSSFSSLLSLITHITHHSYRPSLNLFYFGQHPEKAAQVRDILAEMQATQVSQLSVQNCKFCCKPNPQSVHSSCRAWAFSCLISRRTRTSST